MSWLGSVPLAFQAAVRGRMYSPSQRLGQSLFVVALALLAWGWHLTAGKPRRS